MSRRGLRKFHEREAMTAPVVNRHLVVEVRSLDPLDFSPLILLGVATLAPPKQRASHSPECDATQWGVLCIAQHHRRAQRLDRCVRRLSLQALRATAVNVAVDVDAGLVSLLR
jgi:hypothetical protein